MPCRYPMARSLDLNCESDLCLTQHRAFSTPDFYSGA